MDINNNDETPDQPLSEDPEENLRMENELLRLKLKAELGAESYSSNDLDPALANEFLKHVMAFEHNYAQSTRVKVYERLGKPDFKSADTLDDEAITLALEAITGLMLANNIAVNFSGNYDDRTKYVFITEELFEQEIDDFTMPGMTCNFDYEEFHPNHQLDIEDRAIDFITSWFRQSIGENHLALSDSFILPDRQILTKADVVRRIKYVFDSYTSFTGEKYIIKEVSFDLNGDGGLGNAWGLVKYNAVLENGDIVTFNGPFKLYMSLEYGWWSIFHIVFPGFEY